jgi:hypothetical protein
MCIASSHFRAGFAFSVVVAMIDSFFLAHSQNVAVYLFLFFGVVRFRLFVAMRDVRQNEHCTNYQTKNALFIHGPWSRHFAE